MNTIQPIEITPERQRKLQHSLDAVKDLAARYERDPDLRARIEAGDIRDSLNSLGIEIPPGIEVRIVANTQDTFHVVLPPDPNTDLSEEMLTAVGGGKSAGSVGTAGTVSTAAGSSLLCVGSVGTGGTAG